MDKFGIYNLLSSLSKFYTENNTETNNTEKKEDTDKKEESEEKKTSTLGDILEKAKTDLTANKNNKKEEQNNYNDLPSEYFNKKMYEQMQKHDEFVKRVEKRNMDKK